MRLSIDAQVRQHGQHIHTHGYSIAEEVIAPSLVERVRADLAPYFGSSPKGRNDFEGFESQRLYSLLTKSACLAELVEHPLILGLADRFLRPDYLLSAAVAVRIHAGETPQGFHRDDNPANAPDSGSREMWGFSTIWMFDDFTESNGATDLIPGSHKWPMEKAPANSQAVKACAPAGSVLLFAGNLLHRSGASSQSETGTRLGITIQYSQPWMRTIENFSLAVPPAEASQFSPKVQALLGYSVVAPGFVGFVDGLHPKRLIDPRYVGRKYRE